MRTLNSIAAALALAAAASAQAQIINGGFEAGLNGWTTAGDASTQGPAPAGAARLFLTTAGLVADELDGGGNLVGPFNASGTAAVGSDQLETLAGLAGGALGADAYEGALARQSFTAQAGQTLSFVWDFGTRDSFPDYGFAVIDGTLFTLASSAAAVLPGSGNDLLHTGYQSFTHAFTSNGSHTLAFGVVDVGDTTVRSSLSVDSVQLSAVPEPQTVAMLLAGLAWMLGVTAIRRRP